MKKFFLTLIVMIGAYSGYAQFKIDAEIRPRFEYRNGYKKLRIEDSEAAAFVTQRSRLNLSHTYKNVGTKFSIQDYRIWGESKHNKDIPGVNVYEAYVRFKAGENWAFTAGRQSMDIDNKRLFTRSNWNQTAASHDGITVGYKSESMKLTMLTAFNQSATGLYGTNYEGMTDYYKFLNLIWLEKKHGNISLGLLAITDGHQISEEPDNDDNVYRFTGGGIVKYASNGMKADLRVFYQSGETKEQQNIAAHYISASIGQKFSDVLTGAIGFELQSGNDMEDADSEDNNAFDILYGAKHTFNGMMDYVSTPSTTGNAGLMDINAKFDISAINNLKFTARYHYLAVANNYVFEGETIDKFLGHEIDLIANWKINDIAKMQFGYAMMFASESMETLQGRTPDGLQSYFYTMLTVKPNFFEGK